MVGTFDGSTETLYVNGIQVWSESISHGTFSPTDQPLTIGSPSRSDNTFWTGDIDDVAYFASVLTPAQILTEYQAVTSTGAVLDRGNTNTGSYGIELTGATDVTVSSLSITDAATGIYAPAGSGGTGLQLTHVDVFNNGEGIDLEASNDGASIVDSAVYASKQDGIYIVSNTPTITGSTVFGNTIDGIYTAGSHATVTDSVFHDNGRNGITMNDGYQGLISGNDVYANGSEGIDAQDVGVAASGSDELVVTENAMHDNSGDGIVTSGGAGGFGGPSGGPFGDILVTSNTAYGNTGSGINIEDGTEARDNIVYDNKDGILQTPFYYGYGNFQAAPDLIDGNVVFDNTSVGIAPLATSTVQGNDVYANAVGIQGGPYSYYNPGYSSYLPFNGYVLNNVVDDNSASGILITGATGGQITDNTVYQPQGNGVQVTDDTSQGTVGSKNVHVLNNILWTVSGYDLYVAADSEQGFSSDYDDLYTTGTGKIAYWQGDFTTLRDFSFDVGQDAHSISTDPLFVNPAAGDFHLQNGSSAVAAGDPASDFSNQPAPSGGRINLGAYGNTAEATTSARAGVLIVETGGSTDVTEGGADDSYTLVLTSQPSSAVTITLSSSNELLLMPATVTFTPSTWNVAQSVSVKAVYTGVPEADHSDTITQTAASADPNYNHLTIPSIVVNITANDAIPAFSSAASTTFFVGVMGTFTLTASGSPIPAIIEKSTDKLPDGVMFDPTTDSLSGTPDDGTGGTYTLHFTAHNGVGPDVSQTFTLTVGEVPTFTSDTSTSFTVGKPGSFTVTASGPPSPTLSESTSDQLPSGVTFTPATGTLAGKAAAGSGGVYTLNFTASNGVGSDTMQTFTLTVQEAPAFTSATSATVLVGSSLAFAVTDRGYPLPTLTEVSTEKLPAWLGYDLDSAEVIASPPAGTPAGSYTFHFIADNGIGQAAVQTFTLIVGQPPAFTSGNSTTFTTGVAGSFTLKASGLPKPTMSESTTDVLPKGVRFSAATSTLAGTPAAGTGGTYTLHFTAHNGMGTDATQTLTLTVNQPAAFTSAASTVWIEDASGTFTVQASGFPIPTLSEASTDKLPTSVTFDPATGVLHTTGAAGTARRVQAALHRPQRLRKGCHANAAADHYSAEHDAQPACAGRGNLANQARGGSIHRCRCHGDCRGVSGPGEVGRWPAVQHGDP